MITVWEVGRSERLKDRLRVTQRAVSWDSNTGQDVGLNVIYPSPVIDLMVYWGGNNIPK